MTRLPLNKERLCCCQNSRRPYSARAGNNNQTQNGQHSFIVANGYLNEGFRAGGGNERGTAPDLYISQTALKELFPQYRVFRVAFDTDGQHDESILQELKQITASQANIDIISRYERREEMQEYLITAKVLGTGLSVILLLVGVMNFVNTMVVNVNTRRYELAVLESIGMTKRQIKRMLFMEGFYYWGVSLSLAVTIGTAIFILLYMIFSKVLIMLFSPIHLSHWCWCLDWCC